MEVWATQFATATANGMAGVPDPGYGYAAAKTEAGQTILLRPCKSRSKAAIWA